MKGAMFLVVLATVVISMFSGVMAVAADDGDNFQKAGQKVLAEKERGLLEKKAAIDAFVAQSLADKVATGEEMITLNKMVDDFTRAKTEADGYLKFYDLSTKTVLEEGLVRAVKNYYEYDGLFKRDDSGATRVYFVRLTGDDVTVMRSGIVIDSSSIFLMVLDAFFLFLAIILAVPHDRKIIGTVLYGFFFVLILFLLLSA